MRLPHWQWVGVAASPAPREPVGTGGASWEPGQARWAWLLQQTPSQACSAGQPCLGGLGLCSLTGPEQSHCPAQHSAWPRMCPPHPRQSKLGQSSARPLPPGSQPRPHLPQLRGGSLEAGVTLSLPPASLQPLEVTATQAGLGPPCPSSQPSLTLLPGCLHLGLAPQLPLPTGGQQYHVM